MNRQKWDLKRKWKYPLIYSFLVLINFIPSLTDKPYQPQEAQDVIINLLMVAIEPYRNYGIIFHLATLLLVIGLLWRPRIMGRILAAYIGVNYLIIAAVQTMGHTQKYGFIIHTAALITMIILGFAWLVVAFRNAIIPRLKKPSLIEFGLLLLALLAYWGPYRVVNGFIQPNFDLRLWLISPDYGLTFCFTTPVFLILLIFSYPYINQFVFRVTAFCGLLYALFNLTHWFNPDTRWMGFLHLPLLIISLYALLLPIFTQHKNLVRREPYQAPY